MLKSTTENLNIPGSTAFAHRRSPEFEALLLGCSLFRRRRMTKTLNKPYVR
jgi:hypothetical protein